MKALTHRTLRFALTLAIASQVFAAPALAQGNARVERGRVLMEGIVACGNCHMVRGPEGQLLPDKGMSGGFVVVDEPEMRAVAANITPDKATGIGGWTDAQLRKAIREGIRPDGSLIGPPMPIEFYRGISDADLDAIIAYLRAQPAVANKVEKSVYKIPLPPNYGPPVGHVKAPPSSSKLRYGEYLVRIGHCMDCHTPRAPDGRLVEGKWGSGGQVIAGPWGKSVTRNLTPHESGLKGWSDAEIARAIREGVRRDGTKLNPPMAFSFYKHINDADMAAIIAYLRTLKPLPFGG
jgi:mono/diheme cytochrome c family protein